MKNRRLFYLLLCVLLVAGKASSEIEDYSIYHQADDRFNMAIEQRLISLQRALVANDLSGSLELAMDATRLLKEDSYGKTEEHLKKRFEHRHKKLYCLTTDLMKDYNRKRKILISDCKDRQQELRVVSTIALYLAAGLGDEERVKKLIDQGVNVNSTEDLLSIYEKFMVDKDVRRWLFHPFKEQLEKHTGHYYADAGSALCLAVESGHLGCAEALINAKADLCKKNYFSALSAAGLGGHVACVQLLIDHGANVNSQDMNGQTALHYLAASGSFECVKMLINRGANVNLRNKYRMTALHFAESECVQLLIDHGANVNQQSMNGETVLHVATNYGKVDVVQKLLDAKADVNLRDAEGRTALHIAANPIAHKYHGRKQVDILKGLLNAGANVNLRDAKGKTALQIAEKKWTAQFVGDEDYAGNGECIKVLSDWQAEWLTKMGFWQKFKDFFNMR